METPFNMIVSGMTACGKSFYLLQLLEQHYKNHFENIFLICPTFVHNKTYLEWRYVNYEDFIAVPCDQDDVEYQNRTEPANSLNSGSLLDIMDCLL